ncbi:MAG: hypothetical protein IPH45_12045 [Bacteroidales bacterium]|nr:hypothetical protein [Bacteroidales bacterium]
MNKTVVFLSLLSTFFLTSCIKDFDDLPAPVPDNLKEINVSSNFDWNTSRNIDINITGLPTQIPIFSTLTISLNDGSNLFQMNHEMSKTIKLELVVPNLEENIKIKYGTMEYTLPIENNKVAFSFIPEVTD